MREVLERGRRFIWENGRLLERAIFTWRFMEGPPGQVVAVLRAYQNADGGFGQALEPDVRAPDSQPLFVEFGLRTLYECGLRDGGLARAACDFLARHADLQRGIPTLFETFEDYPHAGHWSRQATQPAMDRLAGLVGLARWQGVVHPWLAAAEPLCLAYLLSERLDDAHSIQNAFCLAESMQDRAAAQGLFDKLAGDLAQANFYCAEAPVDRYGLTPLQFAPAPSAYCRPIFRGDQIEAHLQDLAAQQESDGGWPVRWGPPGAAALLEWRAYGTLRALCVLRAYGKI